MLRAVLIFCLGAWPAVAVDPALRDHVAELFRQRQWAEARAVLERATAAQPNDAEAWHSLGVARFALQEIDQAVAAHEKAVQLDPTKALFHLQLGHAYGRAAQKAGLLAKMGLAKKCKAAYDQAIELDPANLDARWSVMEYCRQAPAIVGGGMEQAYAQAAEIRKLDARRGRAAYSTLYTSEKKYAEAFALYDEVLRAQPGEPDALFNIGRLAAVSGEQLDRGLALLREFVALPDRGRDPRAHTFIGNILERKGDRPGAQAAYEAAVAADPKFTRALEALRKLKEG